MKNAETMEVKDFRPLSLVSEIYKIISKVLAQSYEHGNGNDCFEATKHICSGETDSRLSRYC